MIVKRQLKKVRKSTLNAFFAKACKMVEKPIGFHVKLVGKKGSRRFFPSARTP